MPKELFQVDDSTRSEAFKLFGRSNEEVDDDVKTISDWFKSQPHLPEKMNENKIRNFLLLNKFSIEKTKKKIDMYYTVRSLIPDWFDEINPKLPNVKSVSEANVLAFCPNLVEQFYRVMFYKLIEPGKFLPRELFQVYYNSFEIRLQEDCMVGDILICDFSQLSFDDFTKITPAYISKCFMVLQNVFSLRLKQLHYINMPSFAITLITILKSILKPKIFERIFVHKDDAIVRKLLPEEFVPQDYGGSGPSLRELNDKLHAKFQDYQAEFDLLDQLRVNEDLRPAELENDESLGYHGNFKKLNVD